MKTQTRKHISTLFLLAFLLPFGLSSCWQTMPEKERFKAIDDCKLKQEIILNTPTKVEKKVLKIKDDFDKIITYISPNIKFKCDADTHEHARYMELYRRHYQEGFNLYGNAFNNLFLRAFRKDNSREVVYQIYAQDFLKNWCFYNGAYDANGSRLSFTKIDKDVGTKFYRKTIGKSKKDHGVFETFALNIDRNYLNKALKNGIEIKVYSDKGCKKIITLPSGYIQGFLNAIDKDNTKN